MREANGMEMRLTKRDRKDSKELSWIRQQGQKIRKPMEPTNRAKKQLRQNAQLYTFWRFHDIKKEKNGQKEKERKRAETGQKEREKNGQKHKKTQRQDKIYQNRRCRRKTKDRTEDMRQKIRNRLVEIENQLKIEKMR